MQRRADDDGTADPAFADERKGARRILGSGRGRHLERDLDVRSVPERPHLFRFGSASTRRPAAEHDHLWSTRLRKTGSVGDDSAASPADGITAATALPTATEDDERERLHPSSVRIGPIG